MNCKKFEIAIVDLARDAVSTDGFRAQALDHVRDCSRCAAVLADERRLTSGLRALAGSSASEAAPARVEAALRLAFRNGAASSRTARRRFGSAGLGQGFGRRGFATWPGLGIAAAIGLILLAVAGAYLRHRSSDRPYSTGITASLPPASNQDNSASTNMATSNDVKPDDSTPAAIESTSVAANPKQPRQHLHSHTSVDASSTREIDKDFIPLMYGNDLTLMEGGQVLRVRLARSALASLGFPINMERPDETVQADLLLSNDGLARSIRLVD
jgi:hypothetical protein